MIGTQIGLALNNVISTKSVTCITIKSKKNNAWVQMLSCQPTTINLSVLLIMRYLLDYNWRVANGIDF
jgi:hypothetical protein